MANSNPRNQFVKGKSGNPKGAPKRDWTWAGELEKAAEELMKDGTPIKHHIARSLLREALKGNIPAAKELMNRMDGMPKQDIEVAGEVTTLVTLDTKKDE